MRTRALLRAAAVCLAVVSFVVTLVIAVPIGSLAIGVLPCLVQPERFDAGIWRSSDPDSPCNARFAMVDDLLAGDELSVGRPRGQVEALLGPTEDTDYWLTEAEGLVYVMGCFIDCDWLVIEFDQHGRLREAYTAQD